MSLAASGKWIENLAENEKERQKGVSAFQFAAEAYLKLLHDQMSADVAAFKKHFPDRRVEATLTRSHIEVVHPFGTVAALSVTVYANPITKMLIYEMPLSENLSGYINADVDDGKLVLWHPEANSIELLSERLLTPVLFPGFSNDPRILSYLQSKFGPR